MELSDKLHLSAGVNWRSIWICCRSFVAHAPAYATMIRIRFLPLTTERHWVIQPFWHDNRHHLNEGAGTASTAGLPLWAAVSAVMRFCVVIEFSLLNVFHTCNRIVLIQDSMTALLLWLNIVRKVSNWSTNSTQKRMGSCVPLQKHSLSNFEGAVERLAHADITSGSCTNRSCTNQWSSKMASGCDYSGWHLTPTRNDRVANKTELNWITAEYGLLKSTTSLIHENRQ